MSAIFLSHSSHDKPFARRLAVDLISAGIPVWLDEWEMRTGDSLINRIFAGIDNAHFLMIVVSPKSVASEWVDRELTAALVKEQNLGRTFVLPIKLDSCSLPLKIGDRLYADFSKEYVSAFEKLVPLLKANNLHQVEVPADKRLIPAILTKSLYLNEVIFQSCADRVCRDAAAGFSISASQLMIASDATYDVLRKRLSDRLENIESDAFYTPEFHRDFVANYQRISAWENQLADGLILILNQIAMTPRRHRYRYARAAYWYARILRTRIMAELYNCQNPSLKDPIPWDSQWSPQSLDAPEQAAAFFGVEKVLRVQIGPASGDGTRTMTDSLGLWIDGRSTLAEDLEEWQMMNPLSDYSDVEEMYSKFIIPQVIDQQLRSAASTIDFDFTNHFIGRA